MPRPQVLPWGSGGVTFAVVRIWRGGDLGLWWSLQPPLEGPLHPEQILRTSSEEDPPPGAAYSWTWEGEAGPPPPHRVEALERGKFLSSRAASCFQLCGLHVCARVYLYACVHGCLAATDILTWARDSSEYQPQLGRVVCATLVSLGFLGWGPCRCSANWPVAGSLCL